MSADKRNFTSEWVYEPSADKAEKHLELMFQGADLTMGAKSLLNYHIQVLRDESPLQTGKMKKAQKSSPGGTAAVDDQSGTNSKPVGVSKTLILPIQTKSSFQSQRHRIRNL